MLRISGGVQPSGYLLRRHWGRLALASSALAIAAVIAVLPVSYGATVVVGGSFALLSFLSPLAGLCLLAFAVPFGSLDTFSSASSISAVEPLSAVLLSAWLARLLSRREQNVTLPLGLLPTAFFVALLLLGATVAPVQNFAFKEVLRWAELLGVALVARNVLRTRRQLIVVLASVIGAAGLEALVGWYQFLLRAGPDSFAMGRFLRAYGTFSQPNPFAGYLGMVWPLAASLAVFSLLGMLKHRPSVLGNATARLGGPQGAAPRLSAEISPKFAVLALAATVLIGVAILMSMSRGAWLGVAAAALLLAGLLYRRLFYSLPLIAVLVAAMVAVQQLNLLPATIAGRVNESLSYFRVFDVSQVRATPENWAVVERMASWQAAWRMFEANPLSGLGPGQYVPAYPRFALPAWPHPLGHAHNFYLNIMAETGLLGLLAYLGALAAWFAGGARSLRRLALAGPRTSFERAVVCGVLAALSASLVHNVFDNLYVHGMNAHVGLLLGIMFAADRVCRGGQPSSSQTKLAVRS